MVTSPVFELQGVNVRYGAVCALSGLDITIHRGERTAIIGPSGAGKTSILRLLNGTLRPTEGRVRVLGVDLVNDAQRLREVQCSIGTIYQQFDLIEQLRVIHNLNAGRLGSWPLWKAAVSLLWPREVHRAQQALDRVGIGDKLYARTSDLSGGEQQRVAIARVLVQQPEAVLADEPISSLDPARSRDVIGLLHAISAETGMTLVASMHDVEIALEWFDRVIGLRDGRIVFDIEPSFVSRKMIDALYAAEHQRSEP